MLGTDGNLWLENGPWGTVPPSREHVDGNVAAVQALSATQAYVLGTDGNLWLENGPWGTVPPSREHVDGNVSLRGTSPSTPPPPPFAEKSWGPFGTGPLSDSATVGSGGNECQYQVSVSIQQNGNCTFSGYYENRGNWRRDRALPQAAGHLLGPPAAQHRLHHDVFRVERADEELADVFVVVVSHGG